VGLGLAALPAGREAQLVRVFWALRLMPIFVWALRYEYNTNQLHLYHLRCLYGIGGLDRLPQDPRWSRYQRRSI